MKLLQATWSVIMILDHIHQRLHNSLPDSTTLPNGQKFDLLTLSLFGMSELVPQLNDVTARLQELSFDVSDYICLKFVLLLDPSEWNPQGWCSDQRAVWYRDMVFPVDSTDG